MRFRLRFLIITTCIGSYFLTLADLYAADWYASPTGSGVECTVALPCPIKYAVEERANASDVVHLNDGPYDLSSTLEVPEGVSITAAHRTDPPSARLYPTAFFSDASPLVSFNADMPGSPGGQSMSYIELDGLGSSNPSAMSAVQITNRNDVTLDHNYIHNFNRTARWKNVIQVRSTQTTALMPRVPESRIHTVYPADMQPPGTETNLDAIWPTNPVEGFVFSNNDVINCGNGGAFTELSKNAPAGQAVVSVASTSGFSTGMQVKFYSDHSQRSSSYFIASVGAATLTLTKNLSQTYAAGLWKISQNEESPVMHVWNLKDARIHDNYINSYNTRAQAIMGTAAFLDHVSVYNNDLITSPQKSDSNYLVEVWIMRRGTSFIGNRLRNGGFSITYGKETIAKNNYVYWDDAAKWGYGIEFWGQNHSVVQYNRIENARYGIIVGLGYSDPYAFSRPMVLSHVMANYNEIIHCGYQPIRIEATNGPHSNQTITISDIAVNNNSVLFGTTSSTAAIHVTKEGAVNASNIEVRNNLIAYNAQTDGVYRAVNTADISNFNIDHNLFYENGGGFTGAAPTNSVTAQPIFTDTAAGDYTPLDSNAPQVDSGFNIGDSGAIGLSTQTIWNNCPPSVYTTSQDNHGSWDIGAWIFGTSSKQSPIITANDPSQEEKLPVLTTRYKIVVNASDTDGTVSACKADARPGVVYASKSITLTDNLDGTWHHSVSNMAPNTQYDFYYECIDDDSEHSTEYHLVFSTLSTTHDLIIDNQEAIFDSAWTLSSFDRTCGGNDAPCFYGANYNTDGTQGADSANRFAIFRPTIPVAGYYSIYEWHPSDPSRPTAAPHIITHAAGQSIVYIDQTANENQWNLIGTYLFDAGDSGDLTITAAAEGNTCADAIKWVRASPGAPTGLHIVE